MPIPQEILAVKRPINTVVIAYGKNKSLYAVRQRVGCKNINGRHVPVNGPTIGHIIDYKFVPKIEEVISPVSNMQIDLKDWGAITLCDKLFKDVLDDLLKVYNHSDAIKIYCISILRVCNRKITDNELKEAYEESFLSELYPDVALSKNTVSKFLNDLGKTFSRIVSFMRHRVESVAVDHHLLVDGTLKSNESKINSLSDYSRKAKTKGTRDISLIYAYDLEGKEPVCSKVFPGNMIDAISYDKFISENHIKQGIIVADKGFPESSAHEQFEQNPNLHFLNPIKRNNKAIETHKMYEFSDILNGYEGITYRKEKCVGTNKWLYSFRDSVLAATEEKDWLIRSKKNDSYDYEILQKKQKSFGTVVLESDIDLPPEDAYRAYAKRWEIELLMRYYKQSCEFDETRVHDDYSVIGSEFCCFLSSLLSAKLINEFDKQNLLDKYNYKKIMSILVRAKKVKIKDDKWELVKMNPSYIEVLQKLALLPKTEQLPKRKPGRPKGSKIKISE